MKMNEGHKKHLKEWLLAQVESGAFEGLRWEDEEKTMFRIPWKHAAKKDYKETDDAALFKAWALHKGKHREGKDRANPTVWKTRLRCALNKSTDFQMVPELSQLDISEPYKVYRIQRDESPQTKDSMTIQVKASPRSPGVLEIEESFQACQEEPEEEQQHNELIRDHMYCEPTGKKSPTQHSALLTFCSSIHTISDFRMQVTLLYHGHSVMRCTTKSPDGCFIVQGRGPVGNLQSCFQGKGTPPLYRIELCFGEEYPDPATPKTRKLVMVQVVPMFAVDLLQRFSLEEMKNTTDGPDTNDGKAEKVHAAGRPL
ncbi:interferon regulatory factor 10 isoform X2 [Dunckerocampus dactyliophorus]|uniref:interferon regulatory factor 10 isoform X2 n=1 Tax=Dunckerocampus dactyliophorus TaxID=161453 RepID=UPI0024050D43|nr:interferon regulatory factor 10 isoform X2 [Dunckerocampus dactyliophorus]